MALEGDLATMPLRELLGWLSARRASGALSLGRGMVVRRFHLDQGRIALASSSERPHLLGRMLVERKLVEPSALRGLLAPKARRGKRLGKALARAGLVSEEALAAVLRDKIRALLGDALGWTDGRFAYDDRGRARRRPLVPVYVDLGEVLATLPPPYEIVASDADVLEVVDASGASRH